MATNYVSKEGLSYYHGQIKNIFVAQEAGKGLSSNDFTTEEKTKLEGLANTEIVNDLTSESTTAALSAAQGKALNDAIGAINTSLDGGAMLKTTYDVDGDGVVDNAANATKLGGQDASYYAAATAIPTAVSTLTNDANYQNADQVNATVTTAVANAGHLKREIVEALPAVESADVHTIYMVPIADAEGDNKYTEWMLINGEFEKTGDSTVDLTNYVQNDDLVAITNSEIDAIVTA